MERRNFLALLGTTACVEMARRIGLARDFVEVLYRSSKLCRFRTMLQPNVRVLQRNFRYCPFARRIRVVSTFLDH